MNLLQLPTLAMLACLALPTAAAGLDYDLLVVACGSSPCERIADHTLASGPANVAEFNQDGLRIQIEARAIRTGEVDALISLAFRPIDRIAGALRSGLARPTHRVQIFAEPFTLRPGIFSSIAAFSSGGTFYRVWARLAEIRPSASSRTMTCKPRSIA